MEDENEKKRRWTSGRKLELIIESFKGKKTVAELCREEGVSQSQFHEWKSMFLESGEQGLRNGGGTDREHDLKNHLRVLERKNSEMLVTIDILEQAVEMSKKKGWRPPSLKRVDIL
jgi:transposase